MRGTEDDPLFQAYREGEHSYIFLLPAGNYEVELGFLEPTISETGKRVFEVLFDGKEVFGSIDLAGQFGRGRAVWLRTVYGVDGADGLLIELRKVVGNPIISAVGIRRK
ncbi:MAG: malectin domain-containing carbohydrate-binding protein [Bacteroidota bacterium]